MKQAVQLAPRQLDLFRASGGVERGAALRSRDAVTTRTPATGVSREADADSATDAESATELELSKPPPSRTETLAAARTLAARLAGLVGTEFKVLLTVHDNRCTMISFRRQPPLLRLRLHHMFLDAPDDVARAVIDYTCRGRKTAEDLLDAFIAGRQEHIRSLPLKLSPLEARGRCFDLREVYDSVNVTYFANQVQARIGWGRPTPRRRRRSIRLGVYDHRMREIRLHPALDRPEVPRFFVEFIVFHEMLHQLFPSDGRTGRHVHHPRAFRERERSFHRYSAAMAWEKEHLHELLRR
jgi:hypothetical protein